MLSSPYPKVVQVVGSLGIGGAEQVAMAIAIGVRQRGWESIVVSATGHRNLAKNIAALQSNGVQVKIAPDNLIRKLYDAHQMTREWRPDLIHVHTELPELLGMAMAMGSSKLVLVRTIHNHVRWPGHSLMRQMTDVYYRTRAYRQYACSAAAVWSNSPVIVNGVPWTNANPDKDRHLVSFVGRLEAQKNPAGVIEIVRRARASIPALHLRMLGGGRLMGTLRQAYRDSWIEWLGPRDDVASHIAESQVVVFASQYEGLPLVAIEALTQLTAVVAPAIPGFQGLDWVTRYRTGDYEDGARKLLDVLRSSDVNDLMVKRDRHESLYSRDAMVDQYLKQYQGMLTMR